jgi:hypothetical protein
LAFLKWSDSDQKNAKCYRKNILNCNLLDRTKAEQASRLAFEAGNKDGIMKIGHRMINYIRDHITKRS